MQRLLECTLLLADGQVELVTACAYGSELDRAGRGDGDLAQLGLEALESLTDP